MKKSNMPIDHVPTTQDLIALQGGALTLDDMHTAYESVVKYEHDQLLDALYWVWDFMERASINFYVVGSTAQAIKSHNNLSGDKIQVGVRKNEWESGARRIADAFAQPLKEEGNTVEYEFNGVPIFLYVLEDSATLSSYDTTIYVSEYFKIPNPYSQFERENPWLK